MGELRGETLGGESCQNFPVISSESWHTEKIFCSVIIQICQIFRLFWDFSSISGLPVLAGSDSKSSRKISELKFNRLLLMEDKSGLLGRLKSNVLSCDLGGISSVTADQALPGVEGTLREPLLPWLNES